MARPLAPAAAILIAGVVILWGLGAPPLMQPDEGRNAEVAREMAAAGTWVVPTLEGHPYLDKPAAYFVAVALSLLAFGDNAFAARLPSALCGLGVLAMLYAFARRYHDRSTASLVVVVVATTPLVIAFSRIVIMDMALALCTTAAILAPFVAESGVAPDRRWHVVGAAAAGCGTLVKGPVGFLVPALVLTAFFWWDGRPGALRRVFSLANVAIVVALVAPWFLALAHAHPEFVRYGVVEETFNRFFTPAFHRGQPFWFFGPLFLATLMPWTLLAVPMALLAWRERARLVPADRLLIAWTVVVVVFFSLSRTKQPGYILSGVIAAAALVGRGLGLAWRSPSGVAGVTAARVALTLGALAVVGAAALYVVPNARAWLMIVRPQLLVAFMVMAALGVVAFRTRRVVHVVASFVVLQLTLVTVALDGPVLYARMRSVASLAERLADVPRATEIAVFENYPAGLSFYLGRTLTVMGKDAYPLRSNFITYWLRRQSDPPPTVVAADAREAWLGSRRTDVVIVAPSSQRETLASWLGGRAELHQVDPGWWAAFVTRPGEP
jgi:4-amino-4-deoxy-L-arabinose transferase-like glycosyltransferase